MTTAVRARWALLAAALLFSTGGAAIKSTSFASWWVAGLRSGIAAVAILLLLPAVRRRPSGRVLLVGVAYAATLVLYAVANKLTTSAAAIFLQSTAPIYLLLVSPFLLKEPIRARDVVFLLAMGGGLALFFVDESGATATAPDPFLGNVLALSSGVTWAATVAGLRWLSRADEGGGARAALAGNAMAALSCFAICAVLDVPLGTTSAADWVVVAYLGVFQIGVAYVLVTSALRHVGAFEASLLLLVEPLFNPLWAWIFAGETPGAFALSGGAIVLGATVVKSIVDARAPAPSAT